MAYNILRSNGQALITVATNTVDSTYGVNLIGQNKIAYGESVDENFIHMIENFANTSAPLAPLKGMLWLDTSKSANPLDPAADNRCELFVCVKEDAVTPEWQKVNTLRKAATAPTTTSGLGDLWYNTSTDKIFVLLSGGWAQISASFSANYILSGVIGAGVTLINHGMAPSAQVLGTLSPTTNNTAWHYKIRVVARDGSDQNGVWEIKGLLKRTAGGVIGVVGAPIIDTIAKDVLTWDVTAAIAGGLQISVTGVGNVNWLAVYEAVECPGV